MGQLFDTDVGSYFQNRIIMLLEGLYHTFVVENGTTHKLLDKEFPFLGCGIVFAFHEDAFLNQCIVGFQPGGLYEGRFQIHNLIGPKRGPFHYQPFVF